MTPTPPPALVSLGDHPVGAPPRALRFRRASDSKDLGTIFRLRYQVYVLEQHFERAEDHPGGIECDEFDANAVHFLCESLVTGAPIASVRLILASHRGFPIERH